MEYHQSDQENNLEINGRKEIKFLTYKSFYDPVRVWIKSHNCDFKNIFKKRQINSIYFDSETFDSFNENIFGLDNRFKLRMRWYGNKNKIQKPILECKIKKNGIGFKINEALDIKLDLNQINFEFLKKKFLNLKNKRLQNLFLHRNIPTALICYDREYMLSNCGNIRITIDDKIKIFKVKGSNFFIDKNNYDTCVIEFKFNSNYENIKNILNNFPIRNFRNSKYINAVRAINGI